MPDAKDLPAERISAKATRVAVVGAGVAGLIVAAILRRRGVHCDVFERSSVFDAVGAGIQLSPNGVRILHRLGLTAALAENGVKAQAIETRRWDDGSLIARTPYGPECDELFGAPYYMIHRADLQRCLLGALPHGVAQLGQRCDRVVERSDHVELHFTNGAVTTADLVIGADGVHSVVRGAVVQDEVKLSGHVVHRGIIAAKQVASFSSEPQVLFWLGPGRHVTYYPIAAGRMVHFSAVTVTDDARSGSSTTGAEAEDLAVAFAGWHEDVRRVVTAAESVIRWQLFDRDIAERYSTDRVVLIGDAAHPMLPYLSQGASQALEDAVVLADCLGDCAQRDLGRAVRRYEELRKPRTAEIHRRSRVRGEAFHLADGVRQRERDAVLRRTQNLGQLDWLYGYDAELAAKTGMSHSGEYVTGSPEFQARGTDSMLVHNDGRAYDESRAE
jgi:salicylate hydroxylase